MIIWCQQQKKEGESNGLCKHKAIPKLIKKENNYEKSKFLALILSIIMLVSCVNFVVLAEDGADHFHTEDCCVQEVSMNDVCCEEEHLHEHTTEIDTLLVEEIDDEVENDIIVTPIVLDGSTERRLTFAETTDTFYTLIDFEDSSIILKDPVTKNETVI